MVLYDMYLLYKKSLSFIYRNILHFTYFEWIDI